MTSSSSKSSSKSRSSSRRTSSASRRKSALRKNGTRKIKKRVRINSPKNEIMLYDLDITEKKWKMGSPEKSGIPCGSGIFPCTYRGVTFDTVDEWNEYMENMISRNESTGHRSISSHRRSVMSSLARKGKLAKKIPEEFRLYNTQTGEVFDIRTLDPNSIEYKPLK